MGLLDFLSNNNPQGGGSAPQQQVQFVNPTTLGVPQQYAAAVSQAAHHIGLPLSVVVGHLKSENGGNWNPQLRGIKDPKDFGISQLNPLAVKQITDPSINAGHNYFQEAWGHPFNPTNGNDQILGYASYMNWNKQFGLPKSGVTNPTQQQWIDSYNVGPTGIASSTGPNANPVAVQRANQYTNLTQKNIESTTTGSPQLPTLTPQ